jgi:hypothetical protein
MMLDMAMVAWEEVLVLITETMVFQAVAVVAPPLILLQIVVEGQEVPVDQTGILANQLAAPAVALVAALIAMLQALAVVE